MAIKNLGATKITSFTLRSLLILKRATTLETFSWSHSTL